MKRMAIAGALALASSASAQYVLIGTETAPSTWGTVFGPGSGVAYKAVGFSLSSRPYELGRVSLAIELGAGGSPQVSIWTGEAGPEQQVAVLAGDPAGLIYTPAEPLTLETGDTYWVYVSAAPTSLGSFTWRTAADVPMGMATFVGYVQDGQSSPIHNSFSVIGGLDCYANCDGSTTSPVLNVADFTCFLREYAQGSSLPQYPYQANHYANCDHGATGGLCHTICFNVADFTCFLQRFAAGCP